MSNRPISVIKTNKKYTIAWPGKRIVNTNNLHLDNGWMERLQFLTLENLKSDSKNNFFFNNKHPKGTI